jgi:hypothetical protein
MMDFIKITAKKLRKNQVFLSFCDLIKKSMLTNGGRVGMSRNDRAIQLY